MGVRYAASDRVDLRSDTVTQPTPGMRRAMAEANVGDDVLGDEPTVIELQNRLARLTGKDAAIFVPSGTMANAIAIRAQTSPGDEIVAERHSHIYIYEGGGYAALSGCSIALVPSIRGIMHPEDVKSSIRKGDGSLGHYPNGSLVCVENTSNRGGGAIYPQETMDAICKIARDKNCNSHLDGARMFNAVVATGASPERMTRDFDTVSICLSKGLGSPVGSVLVGSNETISLAHRWRKMFGGGMRQAGIIAAAGIYALENHVERLGEDHLHAHNLAEAINGMGGFTIDMTSVETNMIYIRTLSSNAEHIVEKLSEDGIDVLSIDESNIRVVTHLHITPKDVERTISAFSKLT